MKSAVLLVAWFLAGGPVALADQSHSLRHESGGLTFHYGLVPAEVVLAHPQTHAERDMHGGARRGQHHIVLALFEGEKRIAKADVTVHITLVGGGSATRRLEPMTIAGQPSFGGFVSVAAPGIYKIRFDVRRPGVTTAASAEFEYRASPEGRR